MQIRNCFQQSLLLSALVAAAAQGSSVPNRVLVKFRDQSALKALSSESVLSQNFDGQLGALTVENTLAQAHVGVIRFSTNLSSKEAAAELRQDARVEWAQPDYLLSIFPMGQSVAQASAPLFAHLLQGLSDEGVAPLSDPDYVQAPALPSPAQKDPLMSKAWGLAKISAEAAWATNGGSRSIVVADIDTGIDYTHEDLVNNLWHNPSPTMGDEIGYDFANKKGKPFDDQGHGTHTAGTIGATGGNGVGVSGVSPAVSLMALKFITSSGFGTTSDAILSIDYAIAHGARVMSNSWGGPVDDDSKEENQALADAVKRAGDKDILFVAAAGNDGTNNDERPMYPAAIELPNVLAVASTNDADRKSFFSNYGPRTVHVGAPGSNVFSTLPGGQYGEESGTSMACPHVAGLAALILAAKPTLKAVEVKKIIMETVDRLPALQGKIATGGRINALAALQKANTIGN